MRLCYLIAATVSVSAAFAYLLAVSNKNERSLQKAINEESCEYSLINSGQMVAAKKFYALLKSNCVNDYAARYAIGPGRILYLAEITQNLVEQKQFDELPPGTVILQSGFFINFCFDGKVLHLATRKSSSLMLTDVSNDPFVEVQLSD